MLNNYQSSAFANTIQDAIALAHQSLEKFFENQNQIEVAFGNNYNQAIANQLFTAFAQGNFSAIPEIKILAPEILGSTNGAYSIQNNEIYLNEYFLEANADNPQAIANILIEEIGHFIDAQINDIDSDGDEGEIFASLVQEKTLNTETLAQLKIEDDSKTIVLDGQEITLEQNAQSTSQFLTLAKPISNNITAHGSEEVDVFQLQSYNGLTTAQKVYGYGGADIFNITIEAANGIVGIDFNTGKLKELAELLVEPDWEVREKRLAADMSAALISAGIDYAAAAAQSGDVTGLADGSIDAVATTAHLVNDIVNINANYDLDLEEYENDLKDIGDFFENQGKNGWGTVNVTQSRSLIEIMDFEPGIDTITLPKLTGNDSYTYTIASATNGSQSVEVSYNNQTNQASTFLRINLATHLLPKFSSSNSFGNLLPFLLTYQDTHAVIGQNLNTSTKVSSSFYEGTIAGDYIYVDKNNPTIGAVQLFGLEGDDIIGGRNGRDEIYGGDGNDLIVPGGGNDYVDGGAGYDRVDYSTNTAPVSVTHNSLISIEDIIGSNYNDTINFSGLPAPLEDGMPLHIDGKGGNDSLVGSNYNDVIEGGSGYDTISAGAGNDVLEDTEGQLAGGLGNDTLVADYSNYTYAIALNQNGQNVKRISNGNIILTHSGIEAFRVTGSAFGDSLVGGTGNDTLKGGAGSDTIVGGAGNDRLYPGYNLGAVDSVDGGTGTDTLEVNYTGKTDGAGVHFGYLGTNNIFNRFSGNVLVSVSNVENYQITGTQYDDVFEGRAGDDIFIGRAGNDILVGGIGSDSLDAGAGNDLLNPGYSLGAVDTVDGGEGTDTLEADYTGKTDNAGIHFVASTGNNIFNVKDSSVLAYVVNVEQYKITGTNYSDVLDGSTGNDTFIGGVSADFLTGGAGNDSLSGGADGDSLSGDAGNDFLNPGYSLTGIDNVDGGAGTDTLEADYTSKTDGAGIHFGYLGTNNIFNRFSGNVLVSVSNVEQYNITGTQYSDIFDGNSTNETFNGGAGNDTLNGGAGNDTLNGGAGNDLINGAIGNDNLVGGEGNDILNPGYNLGGVDTVDGGTGTDTLEADYTRKTDGAGIHLGYLGTNNIFNRFSGNVLVSVSNVENYKITGTQYNDAFEGGAGNDTFIGGAGNDTFIGGAGNDSLTGSAGNDSLTGGAGSDTLNGGVGSDNFVFNSPSELDIIVYFDIASDKIQINRAGFGATSTSQFSFTPYNSNSGLLMFGSQSIAFLSNLSAPNGFSVSRDVVLV
jgi:Ca2+-binding RTX toxin-like protein